MPLGAVAAPGSRGVGRAGEQGAPDSIGVVLEVLTSRSTAPGGGQETTGSALSPHLTSPDPPQGSDWGKDDHSDGARTARPGKQVWPESEDPGHTVQ